VKLYSRCPRVRFRIGRIFAGTIAGGEKTEEKIGDSLDSGSGFPIR